MPDRGNVKSKRRRKSKNKNRNKNKDAPALQPGVGVGDTDTGSSSSICFGDVMDSQVCDKDCDNTVTKSELVPDECCDNYLGDNKSVVDDSVKDSIPLKNSDISLKEIINNRFYRVESPERVKQSKKVNNLPKSKSLDDDDDGPINITEVTDESDMKTGNIPYTINESNAIISEADSDVDWEVADDLENSDNAIIDTVQGILSIETISLENAECEQTGSLSPEEEKCLRLYLQTLNLATGPEEQANTEIGIPIKKDVHTLTHNEKLTILKLKKARKKAEIEHFSPSCCRQPFLDVIDEEGSNESSEISRRHSTLVESKSEYCDDDLEDDVFIDLKKPPPTPTEYFSLPKSIIKRREESQEQECLLLGTKFVESIAEQSCGDWKLEKVNELRGAEIVYLDDSSSSTSEIYDTDGVDADIETEDETVRIHTPTIEYNSETQGMIAPLAEIFTPNINIIEKYSEVSPEKYEHIYHVLSEKVNSDVSLLENNNTSKTQPPMLSNSDDIDNTHTKIAESNNNAESKQNNNAQSEQNDNAQSEQNNNAQIEQHANQNGEFFSETKIKELKTELDAALKDLMTETDIENEDSDVFVRQDSSSSICSSQGTAKYIPSNSSLVDITTMLHDEIKSASVCESNEITQISTPIHTNHPVKQSFQYVTGDQIQDIEAATNIYSPSLQPSTLKDICVKKIATLPFGPAILEELASVAESLHFLSASNQIGNRPEVPPRSNSLKRSPKIKMPVYSKTDLNNVNSKSSKEELNMQSTLKSSPPPIGPRQSSLYLAKDDPTWVGLVTKSNPSMLAYLSPSQRDHIERTRKQPGTDEAGSLIDMHNKYLDRRRYQEYECNGMNHTYSKNKGDRTTMQAARTTVNTQEAPAVGNRLLAIIQDPTVNSNVKSSSKVDYSKNKQKTVHKSKQNITSEADFEQYLHNKEKSYNYSKKNNSTSLWQHKENIAKEESYIISTSKDDTYKYMQKKNEVHEKRNSMKPQEFSEILHETHGNFTKPNEFSETSHYVHESFAKPQEFSETLHQTRESFVKPQESSDTLHQTQESFLKPQEFSESSHETYESYKDDSNYSKCTKSYDHSVSHSKGKYSEAKSTLEHLHRKREFILDDPFFNSSLFQENYASSDETSPTSRRRSSLPRDLYERQMQYIIQKEKEIEEEINKLESARTLANGDVKVKVTRKPPLMTEDEFKKESSIFDARKYFISRQGDVATMHKEREGHQGDKHRPRSVPMNYCSSEEKLRQEMYSEYMDKVAQREERKQHKVIKITSQPHTSGAPGGSLPILFDNTQKEIRQTCNMIEEEFISKAKERWEKLGFKDPETEDERDKGCKDSEDVYEEKKPTEKKNIKVIECGEVKDMSGLPSHLREFVQFTANDTSSPGESNAGRQPCVLLMLCAACIIAFALGKCVWFTFRNK